MKLSSELRDWIGTGTVVACALAVAAVYLDREVRAGPMRGQSSSAQRLAHAVFVPRWRSTFEKEKRLGPPDATLTIIEFADFECPFCRSFYQVEEEFRQRHPTEVALVVVSFPLSIHRFAMPAARAADCADQQGRFEDFARVVFQKQDSLGLKEWYSYARDANVAHVDQFRSCIASTAPVAVAQRGRQFAERLSITATPTVLLNGWRLGRPPTINELEASLVSAKQRQTPVPVDLQ